jgi:hypothetical protein
MNSPLRVFSLPLAGTKVARYCLIGGERPLKSMHYAIAGAEREVDSAGHGHSRGKRDVQEHQDALQF